MTEKDYRPGGMTAMLDAIGMGIRKIESVQASLTEEYRAGHVQFVIMTDGMENASRRFSLYQIRQMIEEHRKADGWDFLFLGANIDAAEVAGSMGIEEDRAVDAISDAEGVNAQFAAVCEAQRVMRSDDIACPRSAWKKEVLADRKRRKK